MFDDFIQLYDDSIKIHSFMLPLNLKYMGSKGGRLMQKILVVEDDIDIQDILKII